MHSEDLDFPLYFLLLTFIILSNSLTHYLTQEKTCSFQKPVSINFLGENKLECQLTGIGSCIKMQSIDALPAGQLPTIFKGLD